MKKVLEEPIWISRSEALRRLQIANGTFIRLVEEGRIRTRDFGRRRYFLADIERAIQPPQPAA